MDAATKSVILFGVIGLLLAGSVIAVFQVKPGFVPILAKDGTVSIYMSSIQPDISGNPTVTYSGYMASAPPINTPSSGKPSLNIISLNVTIDSVLIHKSGEGNDSGWQEIFHGSMTIDLLKSTSVSTLIASAKVPEGNITMVRLVVSSATAAVKDASGGISSWRVTVSSGKLEVPLDTEAGVKAQMTTAITLGRPHIVVEGNGQIIRLTPSLHPTVDGPR
jgi:hypothetical protein